MIVVTGLMRSGTSPLAQMLHQMGVEMGSFMRFPTQTPVAHLEWEDALLAEPLAKHLLGQAEIDVPALLRSYILGRHGEWGVKTPFLLPFLRDFREIATGLGMQLRVILTERDYSETIKSLERQAAGLSIDKRQPALKSLLKLQERLSVSREDVSQHALAVNHRDIQRDPRGVAAQLAQVAGIEADLDVATRGIAGGT